MQFNRLTDQPIVGIMAVMSDNHNLGKFSLPTSYVKSVQGSGARVIPVFPNKSVQYYENLFTKLNGLLVPGGSGSPLDHQRPVTEALRLFIDFSKSVLDHEDPKQKEWWPIWGTCLGFECLCVLGAKNEDCLSDCRCKPASYTMKATVDFPRSRIINALPDHLKQAIQLRPISPHVHAYCISVDDFEQHKMESIYKVLMTRRDEDQLEYVTMFESHRYPIYAVMSHHEKSNLQFTPKYQFDHSAEAVQLSQSMMNFFVNECCKNGHKFESIEEETKFRIENFKPIFLEPKTHAVDECYYFN